MTTSLLFGTGSGLMKHADRDDVDWSNNAVQNPEHAPCSACGASICLAGKRSPLASKLLLGIEAVRINSLCPFAHNAPATSVPCHYGRFCSIISTPNHQIRPPPPLQICAPLARLCAAELALQTALKWACFARPAASQTNHPSAIIEIFWLMIDSGNHWAVWVGSSLWPLQPCCWLIVEKAPEGCWHRCLVGMFAVWVDKDRGDRKSKQQTQ